MDEQRPASVMVPHTELEPDLLHAVVESYVLREGTDYGEREVSLEAKVSQVIGQLQRGEAGIVFDPETETVSIVRSQERFEVKTPR
ncbi:MAG TPA: YheU family protein [Steroidobacteraceae bacterium]